MVALELVWSSIFLGLTSSTIFPYIRKWIQSNGKLKFDVVYIYNAIVATFGLAVGNILFFVEYIPASNLPDYMVLVFAFIYGYAGSEAEKLAYKYYVVLKNGSQRSKGY